MESENLKGKDRRALRGRGQTLEPIATIGRNGLTDEVVKNIERHFKTTDLLKVRLSEGTGKARKLAAAELAEALDAELAGVTGRSVLLYRKLKIDRGE